MRERSMIARISSSVGGSSEEKQQEAPNRSIDIISEAESWSSSCGAKGGLRFEGKGGGAGGGEGGRLGVERRWDQCYR